MANDYYEKGKLVVDECYKALNTIELSGPSNNGWMGLIIITESGKPTSITCQRCTGSTSLLSGSIAVDSDPTTSRGDTKCLDGKPCSLTWKIKGVQSTLSTCFTCSLII